MRTLTAVGLAVAFIAGCATAEPPVPGGWSTYRDMSVYYRRHAQEDDGRCRAPYLDGVLSSEVAGETPDELQLRVTYYWRDQVGDKTGGNVFPFGGTDRCKGTGIRTFTFEKLDDDQLRTIAMTGLVKGDRVPSLL